MSVLKFPTADSWTTVSADAPRRIASIVRPGDGQRIRAFGNEIEFMLTAEQTAGSLTLGLAEVPAGNGPPPHVHAAEDELFLVLEGEYSVLIDGEWTNAGPGSVVYLPRGSVHTFKVVSETPGRHWVLTTPSGFERYFARAAEVFAVPGPPDFARLDAINAEHAVAFHRPADGAVQR
jgi:quercetin dioxygenase-like cupin family protein